jgi:hypothetical protein
VVAFDILQVESRQERVMGGLSGRIEVVPAPSKPNGERGTPRARAAAGRGRVAVMA